MRAVFSLLAIALVTLALLPVQGCAVLAASSMRRRIPSLYQRIVCAILGVRITVVGRVAEQQPLLILANHVSWLDIAVITAVMPVVFVAKREVASWPIVGLLAKLQRSVFVDRSHRRSTEQVNKTIAARLAAGDKVVVFAEGTSSDGNRVLPFRTALIGAAREALGAEVSQGPVGRVWLQSLSIAYTGVLGLPLGRQQRAHIAWYGAMPLWPHLRRLVARGKIDVTLTWGAAVPYEKDSDRKAIAKSMEKEVRALSAAALRGRAAAPIAAPTCSAAPTR